MGLLASIVEAWGELRVNKARVLLALIGVAVSVFAMTTVLGGGRMMSTALQQSIEQDAGRPTVLTVQPSDSSGSAAARDLVVRDAFQRLGITQYSRSAQFELRVQTGAGVRSVTTRAVDPPYADMYRTRVEQGRWLAGSDGARLAPGIVIDGAVHSALGNPPVGGSTVRVYTAAGAPMDLTLVGVLPSPPEGSGMLTAYVPATATDAIAGGENTPVLSYLAWVPPDLAEDVATGLGDVLRTTEAGSFDVYPAGFSIEDMGFRQVEYAILGVAGAMLLLGALGLLNISLVTVRYRMREIGIRRSYGATGGRIFVGVLMESVVATVAAGIVGVTAAVALVRLPITQNFFRDLGLVDIPPFPVSAVLIGLAAATAVGALAGIVPALIATRMSVIDAIRA